MKYILPVLALILVLAFAGIAYRELSLQYSPTEVTTPTKIAPAEDADLAPDFSVRNAQGEQVYLSDFIGKPVVLNFWATWCGPCRNELPAFDRAANTYDGQVEFMMVNLTAWGGESQSEVKRFLEESGYTFPVYYDTTGNAARLYGINSIPLTVFIDAEGRILHTKAGMMSETALNSTIKTAFDLQESTKE